MEPYGFIKDDEDKENNMKEDGLLFHKIGLILGTIGGLLIGLVVSDRADQAEIEITKENARNRRQEEEVATNGSEKV